MHQQFVHLKRFMIQKTIKTNGGCVITLLQEIGYIFIIKHSQSVDVSALERYRIPQREERRTESLNNLRV